MARDNSANKEGQPNPSKVELRFPLVNIMSRNGQNNPPGVAGMASIYAEPAGATISRGRCMKPSLAAKSFLSPGTGSNGRYGGHTRRVKNAQVPFQSQAQRAYLYSQHPEIAKRWRKESGPQRGLPKHKRKKHHRKGKRRR